MEVDVGRHLSFNPSAKWSPIQANSLGKCVGKVFSRPKLQIPGRLKYRKQYNIENNIAIKKGTPSFMKIRIIYIIFVGNRVGCW